MLMPAVRLSRLSHPTLSVIFRAALRSGSVRLHGDITCGNTIVQLQDIIAAAIEHRHRVPIAFAGLGDIALMPAVTVSPPLPDKPMVHAVAAAMPW